MVTVRIKDGTPEDGVSLCKTCSWAVVRSGFSATETETFCRLLQASPRVTFKVRECSGHIDQKLPSLYDMEKIAWVLVTKSAGRSIGFFTSARFRELEGEDAEIIPGQAHERKGRE